MTKHAAALWSLILLAGLAGGTAEIAWILGYGAVAQADSAEVARQIGATIYPGARAGSALASLGVAAHLALSLLLAAGWVLAVWRPLATRVGPVGVFASAIVLMIGVWALNFLVVLPRLNPLFVALLPALITLLSKIFFGLAMAATAQSYRVRMGGAPVRQVL